MLIPFSGTNHKRTTKDTRIAKEAQACFVSFVRFVVTQGLSGGSRAAAARIFGRFLSENGFALLLALPAVTMSLRPC